MLSQGSLASIRSDCGSTTHLLGSISVQEVNHHPELFGDFHGVLQLAAIIFSPEWHQSLKRNKKPQKPHQENLRYAGLGERRMWGQQTHGRRGTFQCP